MLELKGKYNVAKVFTDNIDESSIAQIILMCNQEFFKDLSIRIMPDVHAGSGCCVGTTMTVKDKIVPNLVGSDIGCGMETVKIKEKELDLLEMDRLIYDKIPSGFAIRSKSHGFLRNVKLNQLRCKDHVDLLRAEKSIGTLGGGNHFIELDQDEKGGIYLVIHSGSRQLGLDVARYYQNEGYHKLNKSSHEDVERLVEELKRQGKVKGVEDAITKLKSTKTTSVPKDLAYVEGKLFEDYIHDMKIVQEFALWNRKAIADEILKGMKLRKEEEFTTIHNYIDTEEMMLRKGAVSAKKGEKLLIPMNMRDGSLLCIGKGNPDWNCSAPHGAGRLWNRSLAKELITLEEYEKEMEGIFTTSVRKNTIDEAPMVYKDMNEILECITNTVTLVERIRPIYNFKAGSQ